MHTVKQGLQNKLPQQVVSMANSGRGTDKQTEQIKSSTLSANSSLDFDDISFCLLLPTDK